MLLEIAIGDAYGAGFEYTNFFDKNDLSFYVQHPKHSIRPGNYTDDAQMSIAIAEVMVSDNEWTRQTLADSFVNCFKRDPREGYAGGFYRFLQMVSNGEEFLKKIRPNSDKSGAAMRAAAVGLFPTVDQVIKKCSLQASLTHNTVDGIAAANAAALITHYFIYEKGDKKDLGLFLEKYIPGQWNKSWQGKVGSKGWMSVRAAVTAIMRNDRLSNLLKDCINFGGDVDTVAAIAMGPASCCKQIAQDIPANLVNGLENGPYGREYIIDLDKKLTALANSFKTKKQCE